MLQSWFLINFELTGDMRKLTKKKKKEKFRLFLWLLKVYTKVEWTRIIKPIQKTLEQFNKSIHVYIHMIKDTKGSISLVL